MCLDDSTPTVGMLAGSHSSVQCSQRWVLWDPRGRLLIVYILLAARRPNKVSGAGSSPERMTSHPGCSPTSIFSLLYMVNTDWTGFGEGRAGRSNAGGYCGTLNCTSTLADPPPS